MKVFVLEADILFTPIRARGEGRVISVFLTESEKDHNFRCTECGKIAFQYTGDVTLIFDGAVMPEEKATINIMCHRCKIIYRVFVIK